MLAMSTLSDYTEQLIQKLESVLQAFEAQGLQSTFERWQAQLAQMRAYAQANQTVSIAFVGGTGAGKSTLINALLGADLLPTHSFRTCTSAAIAVAHAPRKTYQAAIEFLPLSAWEEEKNAFLEEVQQSAESGHSTFVHQDFLYKAWSLYRPRKGQPPMPFPLEQLLEMLKEPLPQSLLQQLEKGQLLLKEKTAAALKQELSKFLTAESPVWPLIRQVRITGPFAALQDGLELIDLPGLNDPNPVRESITRQALQKAEFIWLIFGSGRGLTREVMELLKEQSFFNQIVLDGKVSALAFIGTRADDFVPELERQHLQLPAEAELEQIRQGRERLIAMQIQQQLSELTLWFANRYKLSNQASEVIQLIASTLQQSPIYLTSALSYLATAGWLPANSARFEHPEQSGIPQLQAYMQQIVAEHGLKARKKLIRSQFQQMNQELRRLVESLKHRQQLKQLPLQQQLIQTLSQLQREQLKALHELNAEQTQSLRLKQIQFEKQLLYAFGDLQNRLEPLSQKWTELNWQYLLRAVRDKGRYSSVRTGQQVDLIRDVQSFLESEVALDWYDFFQHRLLKELDQNLGQFSGLLEQSSQRFSEALQQLGQPAGHQHLDSLRAQGLDILREQSFRTRRELETQIRESQRQLVQQLETSLREQLEPVFAQAAGFSGSGLKAQILEALNQGLQLALAELAQAFAPRLNQILQQLSSQIQTHQQSLAQVLQEQWEMMVEN